MVATRLSLEAINAALSAFQTASDWRRASAFFWHFKGQLLEPDAVSELSAISSLGTKKKTPRCSGLLLVKPPVVTVVVELTSLDKWFKSERS